MKTKTTAALLALFLGGLGAHKFYLGQTGLGILYLLFCVTMIPSIIAFVEFILFLTMDDNKFNQKYNSKNSAYVNPSTVNSSDEIQKLYDLKEKGIITEDEFEARKKVLL